MLFLDLILKCNIRKIKSLYVKTIISKFINFYKVIIFLPSSNKILLLKNTEPDCLFLPGNPVDLMGFYY